MLAMLTADQRTEQDGAANVRVLVYRYIPAVGQPSKADAEYACVLPHTDAAMTQSAAADSVVITAKLRLTRAAKQTHRRHCLADSLTPKCVLAKSEGQRGAEPRAGRSGLSFVPALSHKKRWALRSSEIDL